MNRKTHFSSRYLWAFFIVIFALGFTVPVDAAKPKTKEQQLKQDKRYKGLVEQRLMRINKYLTQDSLVSAERTVKQAEKYIGKISSGFMAGAEGVALRKELDDLKKQVADRKAGAATASQNANALLQEKVNYGSSVKKHSGAYYLLNAGKNKSADGRAYDFDDIETLKNKLPEFLAYESEFRKSFPNLIQGKPDYSYEGIAVGNLLDLIKNAKEYQANFTEVVGNQLLDIQAGEAEKIVSGINDYKLVPPRWLDDIYGKETSNEYFDLDTKLKPYYDAVSRPLPADRMQKLAGYKPKIRKLLEATAKTVSWDGKKYPMQNSAMEKTAERFAEKKVWKLVEYGSTDTAYLQKNSLGVPLHKYYEGKIVVRVPNEPFDRGYSVTFYDYFDGTGYPGISDLKIDLRACPYER